MRSSKYYGTFWIVFEGQNPKIDDDVVSVKLENLFKTKNEFQLFSIAFKNKFERFRIVILSIRISIYVQ